MKIEIKKILLEQFTASNQFGQIMDNYKNTIETRAENNKPKETGASLTAKNNSSIQGTSRNLMDSQRKMINATTRSATESRLQAKQQ